MMFKFHDNMYVDAAIGDADGIKKCLEHGSPLYDVFLICVRTDGANLVDIFHSRYLFGRFGSHTTYTVVGIAYGRTGAFQLLEEIMRDYSAQGMDWRQFKSFFL
jgi:hypothetical protein